MTASSPQMLPRIWSVRDVVDVEMLCRGALAEQLRRTNVDPSPADYDEALAYLLGEVVVLEQRFEERPGIQFRPWLYSMLRRRVIDYWRSWYGRNGQHRIPDDDPNTLVGDWGGFVNIDPPDPNDDPRDSRLERAAYGVAEDGPEASTNDFRRFLDEGDRTALRPLKRLDGGSHPRVERGNHRASKRKRMREAA